MTDIEAIEWLKQISDKYIHGGDEWFDEQRCRAIEYAIECIYKRNKWIPVSERLPDIELVEVRTEDMDLFPCLVVKSAPQSPKKRFVTKAWYDGEGFMDTDCIRITKFVTNWMPLPEPPKGGEG